MGKKFMTVRGLKDEYEIGFTLPHEHLLVDGRNWMKPLPKELSLRHLVSQPVTLENRGEVVYKGFYFEDNLIQSDVNIAIQEAINFREVGGSTIVDLTLKNVGRDPLALYKISIATGLNIIMGCGNYVLSSWSEDDKKKSEKKLAQEIIDEFLYGVGNTGIKPGIIGEVGISDINNPFEIKNLKASGIAQKELNCGINVHLPNREKVGNKVLDILKEVGVNLNRVVLSHLDPTHEDIDYHCSLAKRGAYIEYDQFGLEVMGYDDKILASDGERIKAILNQVKLGNIKRILMSHDVCFKISFTKWGGWGYSHIIKHIIPRLNEEGITQEQIDIITIENPQRLICF